MYGSWLFCNFMECVYMYLSSCTLWTLLLADALVPFSMLELFCTTGGALLLGFVLLLPVYRRRRPCLHWTRCGCTQVHHD